MSAIHTIVTKVDAVLSVNASLALRSAFKFRIIRGEDWHGKMKDLNNPMLQLPKAFSIREFP